LLYFATNSIFKKNLGPIKNIFKQKLSLPVGLFIGLLCPSTMVLANPFDFPNDTLVIQKLDTSIKAFKEKDLKVVFVDFLQSMIPSKFRNNREFEIGYICRELKAIAKEYNICIVATSQLSRAVETRGTSKRPQLSDLRESGAIEQDADMVMFIYRPEYYQLETLEDGTSTKNLAEIIIAKNRAGSLGDVRLQFIGPLTKFSDYNHFDFKDETDFSGGGSQMTPNYSVDDENNTMIIGSRLNDNDNKDVF
jgi:replicative DNA helicase